MVRKIELSSIQKDDMKKLLSYLNKVYNSLLAVRNQSIIALLLNTGIKTSVICSLNQSEYDKDKGFLYPTYKKAPPFIKIDDKTNRILKHYLSLRNDFVFTIRKSSEDLPLFTKNYAAAIYDGDPDSIRLSSRQLQRIIKTVAKQLHLSSDFTPKTFRHLVALYYANLDFSRVGISEVIGNVAPWVHTDYRKINRKRSLITSKKIDTTPICRIHKNKMNLVTHKLYKSVWICPSRGCSYILDKNKNIISQ